MRSPTLPLWLRKLTPSFYIEQTRAHLRRFTHLPDLGMYEESRPRFHAPERAFDHAVLLLHGYSSSTQTFDDLRRELEARGLAHYAPLLTGFGLDELHLLAGVRHTDWLRDALTAFDLLAGVARRVSILGISTGATLGVWVAQQRQVEHLVLVAPNLKLTESDLRFRRVLEAPVLSSIFLAAKPYFAKKIRPGRATNRDVLDEHMAHNHLDYPTLPTRSALAIWGVQDLVRLEAMRFGKLTVAAGAHDRTVDVAYAFERLDQLGIAYDRMIFDDSAHNVLIDRERVRAARVLAELLASRT
jgi:esterase/lipase